MEKTLLEGDQVINELSYPEREDISKLCLNELLEVSH
jgi:hypothetical protein